MRKRPLARSPRERAREAITRVESVAHRGAPTARFVHLAG
jgi:hypothetical protein